MKVPKLSVFCTRKLLESYKSVENVGEFTGYHFLEPILAKMNSKELLSVETNSPYLVSYTDELWRNLLEQHFKKEVENVQIEPGKHRAKYLELENNLEQRRLKALKNLKKNYKMIENEKLSKSAVPLSEDKSIKLINLVSGRRKKRFFNNDTRNSTYFNPNASNSSAMDKVRKNLVMRSNIFKTGPVNRVQNILESAKRERESASPTTKRSVTAAQHQPIPSKNLRGHVMSARPAPRPAVDHPTRPITKLADRPAASHKTTQVSQSGHVTKPQRNKKLLKSGLFIRK